MGSTQSDITQAEFAKSWRVNETLGALTVWENKDDPTHQLEEYSVQDYDEPATQTLYKLRKASPYLVNAYSLQKDGFTLCETGHEATKVFIEKIPLRLSNIKDVPYPDILHLYDTCINGFSILANCVGFFAVDEEFIGVNEQGQVRVWLNTAFESSSVLGGRDITEGHMVEGILELIHNATDHGSFPPHVPSLSDHLGIANSQTTFDTVRQRFVDFVRQHNESNVPLTLGCVHAVGGPHQVKDWCRNNSSFGFEQKSLRLSEKFYQSRQPSKTSLLVKQSQPMQNQIAQPQFYSQYQPSYFNSQNQSSIITPQFQSIQWEPPMQEEQSIRQTTSSQPNRAIFSSPTQSYSVLNPTYVQKTPISSNLIASAPQPQFVSFTASNTTPINIPILQQPIRKQICPEPTREGQLKLQQQRVISQTIEVKDNSKVQQTGFNNETLTPKALSYIATPINSTSKIEIPPKYYEPTYQNQNKKSLQIKNPQIGPVKTSDKEADGKSSPQFLALLSSLKNPKEKVEYAEVYSQVADTPSSYYAKEGSSVSSEKKYFNYTNVHETYSQDAFSSFGQDSNKNIGSNVTNNFPGQIEEDGEADKYSGRYNFSKYERTIDPELMADLQRYN